MQTNCISVVILAAGQSRRFGSQKMRHNLSNGKTILRTSVEQYRQVFSQVTVVIANDTQLKKTVVGLDVNVVTASETNQGMSQSLIAGLQSQVNANAWLIALGDMPYVKTQTLASLAAQATKNNIVAPFCDGRRGNPVILGSDFLAHLLSLQGDVGAKQILNSNTSHLVKVPVDDIGVLHDIDCPDDVL